MRGKLRSKYGFGRFAAVLAGVLIAAACAKPPPSKPPGESVTLAPGETRLVLTVSTLPSQAAATRYVSGDGRYVEETARWGDPGLNKASAGIVLSQAQPAPPLTDPRKPDELVSLWPALRDKRPAFGNLVQSRNALGPVRWRRAAIGTAACVLFVQRWSDGDPGAPDGKPSTLSGYYCNPGGVPLAPGAAETVVRSITLRQGRQGQ